MLPSSGSIDELQKYHFFLILWQHVLTAGLRKRIELIMTIMLYHNNDDDDDDERRG